MGNGRHNVDKSTTAEDILENPGYYGAPTFEEFKRKHDLFMGRDDDKLAAAGKGSEFLASHVKKHQYEIEGYRCKTLEEVERIARSQGIPLRDLDYRPEVIPLGGGKCDLLVKFISKNERERRDALDGHGQTT